MHNLKVTDFISIFIRQQVKAGDLCIDATMGNGHDTRLLAELCGETGQVLSFDIQEKALAETKKLLEQEGLAANIRLILDSHVNLCRYASPDSVSCILFNLGYLPGGDHSLSTGKETTIPALEGALPLLKAGGLLGICIYSGGDTGFEEKDAVLSWIRNLDPRQYLAIVSAYANRPNNPPIPAIVIKK